MSESGGGRQLGIWMCLALVVGNMIGSGIFLLPANLAPLGLNAIWGWVITIGGAMCLATVFSALAKAMPEAGGPYDYVAGAMGASFAVRFARSGADVVLFDSDRTHIEAIQVGGLRVDAPDGAATMRLAATTQPREIGAVDLAVILVDSNATKAAAEVAAAEEAAEVAAEVAVGVAAEEEAEEDDDEFFYDKA